jgi:trehalose synthase
LGTLEDFKIFLDAAHQRGIRVIIELILNHTSDQHPWFQRARRAAPGTPERDFYVWSDTPEKYKEARIIFQDFETSNWTWDPVAKAYYWHRFYSHQPDLNYDNPAVQKAMFEVVDFWLSMGVDGMRLDAVPYLYEREGTSCESLPETHAFLKALRRHIDQRYPDRMLLAEANQWPEDAVAYFGDGDECHMEFHFPLMPRLFMALQMEDRFPIVDILQQTPPIPETCQWAIFLRNHDELTLEMVTDEERDYMYQVYAKDPKARINLGIRRRLAPLLGNSRRRIELMSSLLFSLPGTPVIYYGDEIGMGDNIYLGDRNSVRTPMQWSADRNAGFSRANPQKLYLPVIIDAEYHYEAVNVEAQRSNPHSLWWTMKRMIAVRKRFQAFGRGSFEVLHPGKPQSAGLCAGLRRRAHPGGGQSLALRPVGGAGSVPVGRVDPGGDLWAHRVSPHWAAALFPNAGPPTPFTGSPSRPRRSQFTSTPAGQRSRLARPRWLFKMVVGRASFKGKTRSRWRPSWETTSTAVSGSAPKTASSSQSTFCRPSLAVEKGIPCCEARSCFSRPSSSREIRSSTLYPWAMPLKKQPYTCA